MANFFNDDLYPIGGDAPGEGESYQGSVPGPLRLPGGGLRMTMP